MRANSPAHCRTENGTNDRTHVELTWLEKRIEHWIRFGRIAEETIVDRRRRVVSFAPGDVFAFVRWAANDFGARGNAGRTLFDAAVRTSRRRDPSAHRWLAQGQRRSAGSRRRRSLRGRSG